MTIAKRVAIQLTLKKVFNLKLIKLKFKLIQVTFYIFSYENVMSRLKTTSNLLIQQGSRGHRVAEFDSKRAECQA